MSKVSVIIPVYNVEKYLDQCVQSVMKQKHKDLEIILVNDGSSDNSGKIADNYTKKDKRIKVIHQENAGVSAARNAGIDVATGEYICFIDSDDYVEEDYVSALLNPGFDMSICGTYVNDRAYIPKGAAIERNIVTAVTLNILLRPQLIHSCCMKMYRTRIVDDFNVRFDEECSHGEDLLFVLGYAKHCSSIANIPKALYHYQLNATGLMSKGGHNFSKKRYLHKQVMETISPATVLQKAVLKMVYFRWLLSTYKNKLIGYHR